MDFKARLPSFAFEGNTVWFLDPGTFVYGTGRIVKIDRLQSKYRLRVDGGGEVEVPFDLTDAASSQPINTRDIADLPLINLPEIIRFIGHVFATPPPYFALTRSIVFVGPEAEDRLANFDPETYTQIIQRRYLDLPKSEYTLHLFLASVFNRLYADRSPKHVFLMGKNCLINKKQTKKVLSFSQRVFRAPTTDFFPQLLLGRRLLGYLGRSVNAKGMQRVFLFSKLCLDLSSTEDLIITAGHIQVTNLYASFLKPTPEALSELPVLLYLTKFYAEENPSQFKHLQPLFASTFIQLDTSTQDWLKKKYVLATHALGVISLDF
jgi:hypothetical protein